MAGELSGPAVERTGRARVPVRAGVVLLAVAAAAWPGDAAAQGIRGAATTNLRYLTLRPIAMDTVPWDQVVEVDGGFAYQGVPVYCPGLDRDCVRYRSQDVAHGVILTQDLSATAWGLGVQGLSATVLVRGRADVDGDFVWPTARDDFDAILAYAELQRSFYRVRAGRQRTLSGLGFSGFDGLELALTPGRWLRAEAYGGRSLARGLNEPRNEALQGVEDFVLDQDAWLLGGFAEVEPWHGTALGMRYQREIWADRVGLISERASADVRMSLPGSFRIDGSVDYDFAFDQVGKAHVTLRSRLPWGWVGATARRYVPYFELSTIWGFFSPTPYHEAELEATVQPVQPLTLWARAGWREYGDPEISVIGPAITDATQRYAVGARWLSGPWRASGEYRLETGFGAVLSSGDVSLRWAPLARFALTARGSAFQQIEQFRVGENVVLGGGLGTELGLPAGVELRAGADLYTQTYENRPGQADWDQFRAYTILSIPFGTDPGMRGR